MKEINKEYLDSLLCDYLNNPIYSISRSALNKTKISDLVRVGEESFNIQNHFSIDIDTMKVANQKNSGRCWIFAGLNILRERVAKKYNIEKFELSQNYIAFYDKLEKCNYFLESVIKLLDKEKDDRLLSFILERGIEDGGQWDMFVNIVKKYGVVPQSVFAETYQSENTREIDNVLNRFLRKVSFKLRNSNSDEIDKIKEDAIDRVYKLLCSSFGVPPKSFSFEYVDKDKKYNIIKDLTPLDFFNNYIDIDLDDYVSIINSPTSEKPFNKTYTVSYLGNVVEGKNILYLNLEMSRLKELSLLQLQNFEPVWFGSDCSKYGDRDKGFWDDKSFNEQDLLGLDLTMTKEEMLDTRESSMNHAMVLTGVNIDISVPNTWKIENSWGDEVADKGYYVATDTWFDNYVYQVVINKKYLSEEELKFLKTKPIILDPWDPMGTLA